MKQTGETCDHTCQVETVTGDVDKILKDTEDLDSQIIKQGADIDHLKTQAAKHDTTIVNVQAQVIKHDVTISNLTTQAAKAESTLNDLQQELAKQGAIISNFTAQVVKQDGLLGPVTARVNLLLSERSTGLKLRGRQQLPTPDKFTGENWDTWKAYAKAKLIADGATIGGSRSQCWYLYHCLDDNHQKLVLSRSLAGGESPDIIFDILDRAEARRRALWNLDQVARPPPVTQGSDVIPEYVRRLGHYFSFTEVDEDGNEWTDETAIKALLDGIRPDIREKLGDPALLPTEYDLFTRTLESLSWVLERGKDKWKVKRNGSRNEGK